MTLSQSKKLSQLTADNAQWEDRQLLRSGAVRGTEVQTEFDDEDERKIQNPLSWMEGLFSLSNQRVVFTKQSEPIMPLKDPTSDMAIISRNGSVLVDADAAVVGEEGEVDFKEDANFVTHLKMGEAVSDFAKSKTLAQQRQYLPIFSVRDELLQV
ncbi:RNA helicase [Sarracenia purpurea var. burkii]